MKLEIKIGDSIKVKSNVKCPDDEEISIGGWQGRVLNIFEFKEEDTYSCAVQWDSITLEEMSEEFIITSKEEGLGYAKINLDVKDLEKVDPRDNKEDVEKLINQIEEEYDWVFWGLGEQGKRINQVLKNIKNRGIMATLDVWEKHLEEVLDFPFEAEVFEYQEPEGALKQGDRLSVKKIEMIDDLYGIIIKARKGRKKYHFPLCDLEAIDKESSNYKYLDDYAVWFANR